MRNTVKHQVEALFVPVLKLMRDLRATRFALLGLMVALPLVILGRLQYAGTSDQYQFNEAEHIGVVYLTPAIDFLSALQRHRILSVAALGGDAAARAELATVEAEGDMMLPRIDALDTKYGELLKTSQRWKELKAGWDRLKKGGFSDANAADSAHADLSTATIDWIVNQVGNNSNLILDPDLDSYWLMDALLIKLPAIGDTVSAAASRSLRGGDLDGRAFELAGHYRMLTSTVSDLNTVDLSTVFREFMNPKFGQKKDLQDNLQGPAKAATDKALAFAQWLKDHGKGAAATLPALTAMTWTYQLAHKILPELDYLAVRRADNYAGSRRNGLLASCATLAVLAYLFAGFYLAVRNSTVGMREALVESRTLQKRVQDDNDQLQNQIMDLLQVVSEASEGNLTVRARMSTGALGNVADAFNQLLESLTRLIGDVTKQLRNANLAVGAINKAAQQMAAGATNQAKEVQSATQLVEGMSAKIAGVSENAGNAAGAAKRTEASATEGAKAVQEVINGMESLRAHVQAGAKKMKNLGDRSMEITSIVNTISRISEQTNILALNAAIEAARAGEHGRGFTVVAEEVRKLAERTASATQEIDKLVKAIHVETNETVHAIEQQTLVVEREAQVVSTAGQSLNRIREVSTESAGLVGDISVVAKAHVESTRSVVRTMEQISTIAKQTQVGAETTLMTANELISESAKLNEAMTRFKVA
jgi:methyl-accepting chemotaxis protein